MTELTPQVRLGKIVLDFSTLLCRFCFVGTTTEIDWDHECTSQKLNNEICNYWKNFT